MKRIERQRAGLPRSQQRLADYVLSHVVDVATGSIEELGRAAGVSIATVNRFARAMGYEGYTDFRTELTQAFRAALEPVEKLRNLRPGAPSFDLLSTVLAQSAKNVEATQGFLDARKCESLLSALHEAQRIYVLGFGSSALLVTCAAYHLDPYCPNVQCVGNEGGAEQAVRRMSKLSADDMVIAISFPRYSADAVRLFDFAHQRGATCVALTDGPASPLIPLAHHVLCAKADCALLINSNVAALALLEAIGTVLAHRQSDALAHARDLADQLMPYFYFNRSKAPRKATPPPAGSAAALKREEA